MEFGSIGDGMADGDKQRFARLVQELQGPLFGFLGRMGLDQARGEEIAQETFLRVWQNLPRYQAKRGSLPAWTFAIARNLALNELARAASRRETAFGDKVPEVACEGPLACETLAEQQQRQRLRQALLTLPPGDRSLLALIYVQELSHADVAQIEGCSAGAVKTRAHRARQRLRQIMEDRDGR
jgi:RNA polymerase sigma-70 factor (ECF subfamily)